MDISAEITNLKENGNFRAIPSGHTAGVIDLSSNDYLGLGTDIELRKELLRAAIDKQSALTSSASRLLAGDQEEYSLLEAQLADLYPGRGALIFNSGYHANTGIVSALADRHTVILADRLVHASIIDGAMLSRATLVRWRHADYGHLEQLLDKYYAQGVQILIIAESVYSMDGDRADIDSLTRVKREYPGVMLYIDEAHAFGVEGAGGLGLCASCSPGDVDVMVGTFGKALGSVGAFAIVSDEMRHFLINRARSFIFSTALPPVNVMWTRLLVQRMTSMDAERSHLRTLGARLGTILGTGSDSHIQPLVIGDARRAVQLSQRLLECGVKVLPIRTPTVPPGTERLRFSLSATMSMADLDRVEETLRSVGEAIVSNLNGNKDKK